MMTTTTPDLDVKSALDALCQGTSLMHVLNPLCLHNQSPLYQIHLKNLQKKQTTECTDTSDVHTPTI